MRIFWVSDAVWHRTGYGVTSDYICRRLAADGHEVYNYAPGALHGGMVELAPNLTVLSSNFGDDRWGNGTIDFLLQQIKPDLVVTWLDCQGLVAYSWNEIPVFMWTPVDTWPVPKQELAILSRAKRLLSPSLFGVETLAKQDRQAEYVPCGIDLDLYDISAEGRVRWRRQLVPAISEDTFLVGMVGLNAGLPDRKGYGFAFDALRIFFETHRDARAYIHTNPAGDGGAINLEELRDELGLRDRIYFGRPMQPLGDVPLYMRDMYNSFDVMLHASGCEGFGLPVIEAQACGTPVIANAATSVPELLGPDCIALEPLADMIVNTSTRIALPSVERMVSGLTEAYARWAGKGYSRAKTRGAVLRYDRARIYEEQWRPIIASAPGRWAPMEAERKLMLASGQERKSGYVHHDRTLLLPGIDVAHDLNVFPWPWEDDSWDWIEFSDCLEHLRADMVQVMDELWRITAPDGHVFIHTAEEGSWQLATDPTHVRGFRLDSFDYFDPETQRGATYPYSDRQWKMRLRSIDNAGLTFVMAPRKGVPVESERDLAEVEA